MQEKKIEFNLAPFTLDIELGDIGKYWFTSDLHLNHKNILYFTKRYTLVGDVLLKEDKVIELKNRIISRVNSVLDDESILVNCGDVMLGGIGDWEDDLDKFICKKQYILLGNHDYVNILKKKNLKISYNPEAKIQYSNMMVFRIWNKDKLLIIFTVTHMPQDDFVGFFNIHGHLHSVEDIETMKQDFRNYDICKKYRESGKHFDCGLDRNDYKPVSLVSILKGERDINTNINLNK